MLLLHPSGPYNGAVHLQQYGASVAGTSPRDCPNTSPFHSPRLRPSPANRSFSTGRVAMPAVGNSTAQWQSSTPRSPGAEPVRMLSSPSLSYCSLSAASPSISVHTPPGATHTPRKLPVHSPRLVRSASLQSPAPMTSPAQVSPIIHATVATPVRQCSTRTASDMSTGCEKERVSSVPTLHFDASNSSRAKSGYSDRAAVMLNGSPSLRALLADNPFEKPNTQLTSLPPSRMHSSISRQPSKSLDATPTNKVSPRFVKVEVQTTACQQIEETASVSTLQSGSHIAESSTAKDPFQWTVGNWLHFGMPSMPPVPCPHAEGSSHEISAGNDREQHKSTQRSRDQRASNSTAAVDSTCKASSPAKPRSNPRNGVQRSASTASCRNRSRSSASRAAPQNAATSSGGGDQGRRPLRSPLGACATRSDRAWLPESPVTPEAASRLRSGLRRFTKAQSDGHRRALSELQAGRKSSCWIWYVLPTAPYVVNNVERGSIQNRKFSLRSVDEVREYLRFEADGVNLRSNYLEIMRVVRDQLQSGISARSLFGRRDEPKLQSSVALFEWITRSRASDSSIGIGTPGAGVVDDEVHELASEVLELLEAHRGMPTS